jgi:DNA-binding CsgD family transcriptional regulator
MSRIVQRKEVPYFPADVVSGPADGLPQLPFDTRAVPVRLRSGTPLCAFDGNLQVVAWNVAAEELTGIREREALGRPCWAVLAGTDDHGALVCHRGCSGARLARNDWPLGSQTLNIKTANGRRRVAVETVTLRRDRDQLIVHLFRPAPRREQRPRRSPVRLTPRRLQVLKLLAGGLSVRKIARRLGIRETTVRNHVHGLLVDLDAHSQLEAVAKAREHGLL